MAPLEREGLFMAALVASIVDDASPPQWLSSWKIIVNRL